VTLGPEYPPREAILSFVVVRGGESLLAFTLMSRKGVGMSPFPYRTTVYVHGAGQQEHPLLLKRRLDGLIFGAAQGDRTVVGYYSHILHGLPADPVALEGARPDPIAIAANSSATQADVVAAIAGSTSGGLESSNRRVAMAHAFVERADEVAAAETGPQRALEGVRFPDRDSGSSSPSWPETSSSTSSTDTARLAGIRSARRYGEHLTQP